MAATIKQFELGNERRKLRTWSTDHGLDFSNTEEESKDLVNTGFFMPSAHDAFYSLVMFEVFCTSIVCFVLKTEVGQEKELENAERILNMMFVHCYSDYANASSFISSRYRELLKFKSAYIFSLPKTEIKYQNLMTHVQAMVLNMDENSCEANKMVESFNWTKILRNEDIFIMTPSVVITNIDLSDDFKAALPMLTLRIMIKEKIHVHQEYPETERTGKNLDVFGQIQHIDNSFDEIRKIVKVRNHMYANESKFLNHPMELINSNFNEVIKKMPGTSYLISTDDGLTVVTLSVRGTDQKFHIYSFAAMSHMFEQTKYIIPIIALQGSYYANPKINALLMSFTDHFECAVYYRANKIVYLAEVHEAMVNQRGWTHTLQQLLASCTRGTLMTMRVDGEFNHSKSFVEALNSYSWREMEVSLLHVFHLTKCMIKFAKREKDDSETVADFVKTSPYANLSFFWMMVNRNETELYEDMKNHGISLSNYNRTLGNLDMDYNGLPPNLMSFGTKVEKLRAIDRYYFNYRPEDNAAVPASYRFWSSTWADPAHYVHSDDALEVVRYISWPMDKETAKAIEDTHQEREDERNLAQWKAREEAKSKLEAQGETDKGPSNAAKPN